MKKNFEAVRAVEAVVGIVVVVEGTCLELGVGLGEGEGIIALVRSFHSSKGWVAVNIDYLMVNLDFEEFPESSNSLESRMIARVERALRMG